MQTWNQVVEFVSDHSVFFNRLGQIVTVLSAIFAFYNSWSAKKALLAERAQRTRKGAVEYSVTFRRGGKYRLAKLAMKPTNSLFTNPTRENLFRNSGNENTASIVNPESGSENIGLQDSGDVGENKFFSLTHANIFAEMTQLPMLWAAAGVPSRDVKFIQAFRYDTYSAKDPDDGYQTGRCMLIPLAEIVAAGENTDFLENETEVSYQKDRLHHMREIYRVWKSDKPSDKWRVLEITIPVPEILFLGSEITKLETLTRESTQILGDLRELGGQLKDSRLDEIAKKAAQETVQRLGEIFKST